MLTKHSFKVLLGFCAVILVGLISLVVIDSMKASDTSHTNINTPSVDLNTNFAGPGSKTYK